MAGHETVRDSADYWSHLGILLLVSMLAACSSTTQWVRDSPEAPVCIPDRLLTWQDFTPKTQRGRRAAETAIRLSVHHSEPPRIVAIFEPKLSWVRSDFAFGWNPFLFRHSAQLLRHEQLHFSISCLLAREANASLQRGGDPQAMLMLLNAVATRMNVQYDTETNHGLNRKKQEEWEEAIQARLIAGPLTKQPLNRAPTATAEMAYPR